MTIKPSMSKECLQDGDYEDGEIYKVMVGTPMWQAVFQEKWENFTIDEQQQMVARLRQPTYYLGTIVSRSRLQIEVTCITLNTTTGGPHETFSFCITVSDFHRFV